MEGSFFDPATEFTHVFNTTDNRSITKLDDPRLAGIPSQYTPPGSDMSFGYLAKIKAWNTFDYVYQTYTEQMKKGLIDAAELGEALIEPPLEKIDVLEEIKDEIKEKIPHKGIYTPKPWFKEKPEKVPFDPANFPTLAEIIPEYVEERERSLEQIKIARKKIESMTPSLQKLMKKCSYALREILDDTVFELETILSDKKRLEKEILKAEKTLEYRLRKEQKKRHEATGIWGFIKYGFEELHNEMNPGYVKNFSEVEAFTNLRETVIEDLKGKSKKQYQRLEYLIEELEGTGVMDMLKSIHMNGRVSLENVEGYEEKRRALYQKMIQSFSSKDIESRYKFQNHVIDVQEFLLEDMKSSSAKENEYQLFMDALLDLYGFDAAKQPPEGMSRRDWKKQRGEELEELARLHREEAKQAHTTYKQKWWKKPEAVKTLDVLKRLFVDQQYPGNISNITTRAIQEYTDYIDDVYNPGIIDRFMGMIKSSTNAVMELIPELIPLIPGTGVAANAIEKFQNVAYVFLESQIGKTIGSKLSKFAGAAVGFALRNAACWTLQYLAFGSINTLGIGVAAASYAGLDKWLTQTLLGLLGFLPGVGWGSRWFMNIIDFTDANREHVGIMRQGVKDIGKMAKGSAGSVVRYAWDWMNLKMETQKHTGMVNALRSKVYQMDKIRHLKILREIAAAKEGEDITKLTSEFTKFPEPTKKQYNLSSLGTEAVIPEDATDEYKDIHKGKLEPGMEGIVNHVIEELTNHMLHMNPRLKNPADAWKKTFTDAHLNDELKTLMKNDAKKLAFEGSHPHMESLKFEAAKAAESTVRAFLNVEGIHEGIPTVSSLKTRKKNIFGTYKTLVKKQERQEITFNKAVKEGNVAAQESMAKKLEDSTRKRYALLYEMSYFDELAEISKTNHDEMGQDAMRAALFVDHQFRYNSAINPKHYQNVANYADLYEQKKIALGGVDPFQGLESSLPLLEKLHRRDAARYAANPNDPNATRYRFKEIAQELQGLRDDEAKKAIEGAGKAVNLINLEQAGSQLDYFQLYGNEADGVFNALFNFGINLTGWASSKIMGGKPLTWWRAAKTGVGAAWIFGTAGLNANLIFNSPGFWSVAGTHFMSNNVLIPLAETLFGQSYSEMNADVDRVKKAIFEMDDKLVQRREAKFKYFKSTKKRKLDSLAKKRLKYMTIKDRSKRIYDATRQRFSESGGIDAVKKVQAAEHRYIAEEIQYENLIRDIDAEISAVEKETFEEIDRDDVVPNYDKQMAEYRTALNDKSYKLKMIEHLRAIPQYVNWLTLISMAYSVTVDPESQGYTIDSAGRKILKFQKQQLQKETGFEWLDWWLGINQTPTVEEGSVKPGQQQQIPEHLTMKLPDEKTEVPPSSMIFSNEQPQDVSTVPKALEVIGEKQNDLVSFLDKNYVLYDPENKKIYEDAGKKIQLHLDLIEGGLEPDTSTMVDLSKPFSIIPDTPYTRRQFDPEYEDVSIFERYPEFALLPPAPESAFKKQGSTMPYTVPPPITRRPDSSFLSPSSFTMSDSYEEKYDPTLDDRNYYGEYPVTFAKGEPPVAPEDQYSFSKKELSIFDMDPKTGAPINKSIHTKVRLLPRAIFQHVMDPTLKLDKQEGDSTGFYDKYFSMFDKNPSYKGPFQVMVDRFDKQQISAMVSAPQVAAARISRIREVYGTEIFAEERLKSLAFSPDGAQTVSNLDIPEQLTTKFGDFTSSSSSRMPPPRFNFYDIEPGTPYTQEEVNNMRVSDAYWIINALEKRFGFGIEGLKTDIGMENARRFLQSTRNHHDLQSFLRRQQALETAGMINTSMAWINFAMGWLYGGIEYDIESVKSTAGMTGTYLANLLSIGSPDNVEELINEIDALQDALVAVNKLIAADVYQTGRVVKNATSSGILDDLGGFSSMGGTGVESDQILSLYSRVKNFSRYASSVGYSEFEKGKLVGMKDIEAVMEMPEKLEAVKYVLGHIAINLEVAEKFLEDKKYEHNMFMIRKSLSALVHETNDRLWTSTKMYFDYHAKVTDFLLLPAYRGLEYLRGVDNEHVKLNPAWALLSSLGYVTLEQAIHHSVNVVGDFMDASSEASRDVNDRLRLEDPHLRLLSELLPLDQSATDEQRAIHPSYDYRRITEKTYGDTFFNVILDASEYVVDASRSLGDFNPNTSRLAYAVGKTANTVAGGFKMASSVANAVTKLGSDVAATVSGVKQSVDTINRTMDKVADVSDLTSQITSGFTIKTIGDVAGSIVSYPSSLFPEQGIPQMVSDDDGGFSYAPEYINESFIKLRDTLPPETFLGSKVAPPQEIYKQTQTPTPTPSQLDIPPSMTPSPNSQFIPNLTEDLIYDEGEDYQAYDIGNEQVAVYELRPKSYLEMVTDPIIGEYKTMRRGQGFFLSKPEFENYKKKHYASKKSNSWW